MDPLKKSERIREYKDYPANVRGQIAYVFLREKVLGHRSLDQIYLGKDPAYTKGFQSMGILHHLGLVKIHHGIFKGFGIDEIIKETSKVYASEALVSDLIAFRNYKVIEQKTFDEEFQTKVKAALKDDPKNRKLRLSKYDGMPKRIQTISYSFERNADVVAEALIRANGICEKCNKPAPFMRKKDGSAYLEVHHKIPLSENGLDLLESVLALCPNCHRELHYGADA
jgi:hypothetical protein